MELSNRAISAADLGDALDDDDRVTAADTDGSNGVVASVAAVRAMAAAEIPGEQ